MPNINIDDAYILNETGAQVDKVTGLYFKDESTSAAEKAFAQLNIGTAGSNRNLLDNPWFTVNQRGKSSYGQGAIVDRWINLNASVTITVTDDGLTLPRDVSSGIRQKVEPSLNTFLIGKNVVFSVLFQDGTIAEFPFVWSNSHTGRGSKNNVTIYAGGLNGVAINRLQEVYVRAVKLELGSVSTLANDAPPEYGEELAKCQRYFQRVVAPSYGNGFGFGRAHSATECRVYIPLPVPLRASPTVSIANIGSVSLAGNGNTYSCSAMAYSGRSESGVNLSFTTSGLTTNQLYLLYRSGSADIYIDLSADL